MSVFTQHRGKWKNLTVKISKYLVLLIIILAISCLSLFFLRNTFYQEIFSPISIIIDNTFTNLLNVLIILLIGLPTFLLVSIICQKNKYIALLVSFVLILLILIVAFQFSPFGLISFPILQDLDNFIQNIFQSIDNLLPFIIILPFLVIYYYINLKTRTEFKLTNLSIRNHILLIDDGKKKNFKALTILQIKNIPQNIIVKEERHRKTTIEKLMIPGNLHYLHYHLTSLAKIVPYITYEIRVLKNDIVLRLILTLTGNEINQVIEKIEMLRDSVIMGFQTTFPGIKFSLLRGNELKNAWGDILGGWGSYKFEFFEKDKIIIDKIIEKTFLTILKFENVPLFKIINKKSQIDAMIRGFIGANFDLSYVISAKPLEIYDFKKQKQFIEKEVDRIDEATSDKKRRKTTESRMNFSLRNSIEIEQVREDLINIRHAEITGIWEVSAYLIVRSDEKQKLEVDIQKLISLISTIFGLKLTILESNKLKTSFSRIPMRDFIFEPTILSSEQLAIYFHLPENPIPSLSRFEIPEFEIPPENRIPEGISIGTILLYDQEMYPLNLTLEDIRLNMFISGLIGTGKTRLIMNILKQLTEKHQQVNWICLDWKGEYIYLKNETKTEKITVFRPGSDIAPLELNMFDPQNSNSDEHARKVFAIIREVFKSEFHGNSELSVQMESVCKEVIRNTVNNPRLRNLTSFLEELNKFARENMHKNKTIIMTITALINRFDKFRHGVLKKVFDVQKSNIKFEKLMGKKVIIDFSYLLSEGGAKSDVRLLMNLILKYVIDKALERGITDDLKHIVVIEDSQFLIPSILREVPETSLVEDIPLLLRGVGESLITIATRPEISSDVIANSAIKIAFKSPYDSQKIAKYQNLSEIQEKYLRILPKREAIVTLPNFQFPFRIFTSFFEYRKEVQDENGLLNSHSVENYSSASQDDLKTTSVSKILSDSKTSIDKNKNQLKNNDIEIKFAEIRNILKNSPKNKYQLSKELSIPKAEVDIKLQIFLKEEKIGTCIAPIFNTEKKQKLYFLPEQSDYIKNQIKQRIENDFLINSKIGKLSEQDLFDYIWYGNNTFMKIFQSQDSELDLDKIGKFIFDCFEAAIERGSFELIVIVPFVDWSLKLRNWLDSFDSHQILVFAYNINDWQKLRRYLERGIKSDLPSN